VVVSGAAGAVGNHVGQLAKLKGKSILQCLGIITNSIKVRKFLQNVENTLIVLHDEIYIRP